MSIQKRSIDYSIICTLVAFRSNPVNCFSDLEGAGVNKFQAMVKALMLLNEDGLLTPGSQEYHIARKMITYKIERLGPEAALEQVKGNKAHLLAQFRMIRS